MKQISKSFLTFLALTLFGGAGAWAQGPTQVTRITTDMIASWETDINHATLADLQALGFEAVDEAVAMAWTGAPQDGLTCLFYGFKEIEGDLILNYIMFNGGNVTPGQGPFTKSGFYHDVSVYNFFYTGSGAIELTKVGANQWTLGQAPDYDLELQVEYYEAHALKNIPAGWQVMVNGVDKTSAIAGDSLMIVETDSVTLIPDNPRLVKSVTLADDAPALQTLIIGKGSTQLSGDKELYYITGDTYRQALARPENQSTGGLGWGVWESSTLTTIFFKEVSNKAWDMAIDGDSNFTPGEGSSTITLDSVIDPNHAFQFISTK